MSNPFESVTVVTNGGTGNQFFSGEIPVDMYPSMFDSYTELTPLTVILAKLNEREGWNYQINWSEKKEIPTDVVVATSESTVGTSITVVAHGTTLVLDTLLYNPRTNDLRRVSVAPTSNSLTVAISQGGTTSGSVWKSQDVLHVILPSLTEDDENYRTASVADDYGYNYVQLCKLQFSMTRLANAMKTYTAGDKGGKRRELQMQKYREYRIKKEKLLYFGGRASSGTAPSTRYQMGGMNHFLRSGTLFKDFNGILTESGFRNMVGDYKDQNPDATEIMYFMAGNAQDIVCNFGADKVRIDPMSEEFGLDIMRYKARGITARFTTLPLLDNKSVTRGWGFGIDLERMRLTTIDRDMLYKEAKNIGESEKIIDTYRSVHSLMIANESRHQMFIGALN